MAGKKPIVIVGSINMDLAVSVNDIPGPGETIFGRDFGMHPGGKGANQAVCIARLGYPVKMIGRVGRDPFGIQLLSHLEDAGVDCSSILSTEGASGTALIVVSARGENSIVVVPGVNTLVSPADIDANISTIRGAGAILTQLEIPIETVSHLVAICSAEGIPLILDPAPAASLPASLLRGVTWFTPNETEAAFFLSDFGESAGEDSAQTARALIHAGVGGVVLKLGSQGAFLADGNCEEFIPAFPVQAVDTTAAGDAFNGAFATGLMLGKTPLKSALFASAAAAISVTRLGAQLAVPSLEEVEDIMGSPETTEVRL